MNQVHKKYKLAEHTPMGDRETNLDLVFSENIVTGTVDIDAGPDRRATVTIFEGVIDGNKISFLIEEGNISRRYRAMIDGNAMKGEVEFEGETELSGIKTPFDGKCQFMA